MFSEIMRTYVAGILSPTTLIALLLITSLYCLKKHYLKTVKVLLLTTTILYALFTTSPLRYGLYSLIETDPVNFPQDYKYVVVLGARIYPNDQHPLSSQLSSTLLSRISYGIELVNKKPGSLLIVTGNGAGKIPEAHLMGDYALSLGLPKDKLIIEDKSMNTKDHPIFLRPILKDQKFVIVTSAYHMNRALKNFKANNLEGYGAPTDYVNSTGLGFGSLILRGENLAQLDRWFSEIYSKTWTEIRLLF